MKWAHSKVLAPAFKCCCFFYVKEGLGHLNHPLNTAAFSHVKGSIGGAGTLESRRPRATLTAS